MFCPQCKTEQQWGIISFLGWFTCPNCGVNLHIPDEWTLARGLLGLLITVVILVMVRRSLLISLLLFIPLYVCAVGTVIIVWLELFPPKLETDLPSPPPGFMGFNK